jgi:hypothetical protein
MIGKFTLCPQKMSEQVTKNDNPVTITSGKYSILQDLINTENAGELLVSKDGNYDSPLCDIKNSMGYRAISDLKGTKGFPEER